MARDTRRYLALADDFSSRSRAAWSWSVGWAARAGRSWRPASLPSSACARRPSAAQRCKTQAAAGRESRGTAASHRRYSRGFGPCLRRGAPEGSGGARCRVYGHNRRGGADGGGTQFLCRARSCRRRPIFGPLARSEAGSNGGPHPRTDSWRIRRIRGSASRAAASRHREIDWVRIDAGVGRRIVSPPPGAR